MGRRRFSSLLVLVSLSLAALAGCDTVPPPATPLGPVPDDDSRPIAMGSGTELRTLRPMVDHQRERLREIIDLAERRELREGGPRGMLRTVKEESKNLDRIEARLDDLMRMGGGSNTEADSIGDDLQRFSSRLSSLESTLR